MPRINVRLDDVQGGFGIFPDGIFFVELTEHSKVRRGKVSGEATILWIAKILEGEFEGKLISWNTSLQEVALWNLKSMLEKLGFAWDEDGFEMDDIVGHQLGIHNTSGRENQGQPVNTIDAYYSIEELTGKTEEDAARIAAPDDIPF